MFSDKVKKFIFDKLDKDLSNVEIILHNNNIWFIDRENKYWYFVYEKSGNLLWKYSFFMSFFQWFSLSSEEFEPIIGEWVEKVLNCKVLTTSSSSVSKDFMVEKVLNYKVLTTTTRCVIRKERVEKVLNCKVSTTEPSDFEFGIKAEESLTKT
jgi:hypothetical protein